MSKPTAQQFQLLFESAPGHYLVLHPDLRIAAVSDTYLQATMTRREEITGRDIFEVFPDNPDDPAATGEKNLRDSLQQVIQFKQSHSMAVQQYDIRRANGEFEQRYWSPVNKPVLDEKGDLLFIIHRVEDVTDFIRKEKDEARQAARIQDMEMEIYKRAQEIQANNQLLQTEVSERKKAEELTRQLNQELESFTYSVSHDLRSPLRIIDGYAEILTADYSSRLDEEGNRNLNIIRANARKMGQLIDDLLQFSRAGRQEVSRQLTNMQVVVQSVLAELELSVKHHALVKTGSLLPAYCDKSLIRQVWINLISNAIKYSQKEPAPLIEISCIKEDAAIIYSVKDNGVGFSMKYAAKLFGVFQRLHKEREFEGTGIGLALVNRIIQKHGGRVWAEASPGNGAVFFFSLPDSDIYKTC